MGAKVTVDADELREEVKSKYREVALDPQGDFHFHTGASVDTFGGAGGEQQARSFKVFGYTFSALKPG